jgi:Mg2+/Co2+ transporter CorB
MERSSHYAYILEKRLLAKKEEEQKKNVEIYDKAFFLNEEMNSLKEQLEKLDENLSESM